MARRAPKGRARLSSPAIAQQSEDGEAAKPAPPLSLPGSRLLFRPDWLPMALVVGDAIIAAVSVLLAYWYRHHLDPIRHLDPAELPIGPYLVGVPVVVVLYVFALALNNQYQSWRGRTLAGLLLQLYSG